MGHELNILPLLQKTKTLVQHQRELEKTRGESFNVFSVLDMERLENRTHSAFLGELLNPKGSHQMGSAFLSLFIHLNKIKDFDTASATLTLEKHISKVDLDKITGGRIDIYIEDHYGNSICIENKIDAEDQQKQIERYVNFNKEKNTVFYLTLDGDEPSDESQGELKSGEDFYCLSYEQHIKEWLTNCHKEAVSIPILRESIRQYILLIDKITSTMESESEKKLMQHMLEHYEEAEYITQNFDKIQQVMAEEIRSSLIKELKKRLPELEIEHQGKTSQKWTQIWISEKDYDEPDLFFGLESFSPHNKNRDSIFLGIYNNQGKSKPPEGKDYIKEDSYWYNLNEIVDLEGYPIHMGNARTIKRLHRDEQFKIDFINHIADHTCEYIKENRNLVIKTNKKRRKG